MKHFALLLLLFSSSTSFGQNQYDDFLSLIENWPMAVHNKKVNKIASEWREQSPLLTIEVLYLLRNPPLSTRLMKVLREKTGEDFGTNFNQWYEWWWEQEIPANQGYLNFKADLYKFIDAHFEEYFLNREEQILIDPTEIRWGGVAQDGIPPLRQPEMIEAKHAYFMEDDNVVFGLAINGDIRAYPKRILAWHEMFVDKVGGINIAGVYCTLCGTVIAYDAQDFELGTSGFLYRSNKLMYDQNTQSLWSTLDGVPVVGSLINKNIELEYHPIVTTTWGAWKKLHPETKVLSLNTGHQRNYDEGVAYAEYFASDQLMFSVKHVDKSLENKDEVLVLKNGENALAIHDRFLARNNISYHRVGDLELIVITDKSGANRAYEIEGKPITKFKRGELLTEDGSNWTFTEDYLTDGTTQFKRFPAFRAFWFGWYSANPDTKLVK